MAGVHADESHESQQVRSARSRSRPQAIHRRMVCGDHAGFESAQREIGPIPYSKFHLVGRIFRTARHSNGYLALSGQAILGGLDQGYTRRIPELQHCRGGMGQRSIVD